MERLAHGDTNSLIPSDLYRSEWDKIDSSQATPTQPMRQFTDPASNVLAFSDCVRVNRLQAAPASGRKTHQFVAPANCREVTLEVEAALPPTITNQTIVLGLYAVDGTTVLTTALGANSEAACVLTSAMRTYSVSARVTPGTEYRAQIHFHNVGKGTTSQATALIRGARLRPSDVQGGGIFANTFQRIHVESKILHDNVGSTIVSRRQQFTPWSRLVLRTVATSIVLEYVRIYQVTDNDPVIFVNGEPWANAPCVGNNALNHVEVALPPGEKTIEIWMPGATDNASYPAAPSLQTCAVNAVYVPDTSVRIIPPSTAPRRLVCYGDSIIAGKGGAQWMIGGIPAILRKSFPGSVGLEAFGSRTFAADVASGGPPGATDATKTAAWVAAIQKWNPTDLIMAIGTNDYSGNYWAAAAFGTAYAAALDALHAAMPNLKIWCLTPLKRATETANGSGSTLGDYRTQITTVCSTRTSFATAIDGNAILSATTIGINNLFADTVHPNENGHAAVAEQLRTSIGW